MEKFLNIKINLSQFYVLPRAETKFWVKKVIKEIKQTTNNRRLTTNNKQQALQSPVLEKQLPPMAEKERQKPKVSGVGVGGLLVFDLFSGTGFIGIAILKDCPEFCRRVDFGDIDKKALQQIKINLKLNKISLKRVKIIQTDIFSGIKGKYDLILANPPYVAKERLGEVQLSVKKYEPKTAWYGKKGGLFYIEKFLSKAKNFLKENGIIYLEIDTQQKKYIENLLRRYEYPKFTFGKDQFGKYRWVKIIKTP
ncbi:MAG: hypothetical protein CO034_01315 [Parcubacteria group bacterium CG_4_9_14_0_2_um_filter_35_11]|nr:MAG: hypothetical protein CO034_01315 [Parcubacteria group bacterium CG_4_9_14_0_2_um_filter_35_11]